MEEIKVNFENLTEEERQTLLKLIEKGNASKGNKAYKPNIGDEYYYIAITTDGVRTGLYQDCLFDKTNVELQNCFKSKKKAKKEAKKQNLLARIRAYQLENDIGEINWNDYQEKYFIYYSYVKKVGCIGIYNQVRGLGGIYFNNKDVCKACLEKFKKEIEEVYGK